MPSRADVEPGGRRVLLERVLRVAALALLAFGLWRFVRPETPAAAVTEEARGAALGAALARWTTRPVGAVYAQLDSAVDPATRDWLAALRGAGARVAWGADSLAPLALALSPVRDPAGGTRLTVAAPAGTRLVARDAAGVIDTLVTAGAGASLVAPAAGDTLTIAAGRSAARALVADSLRIGRLLVLGRVGWESKFVIAALEERGWTVSARLALAPGRDVVQGADLALDTARFAAVIALDATAARDAARIVRFVRSGGGLVLAGEAASVPALATLAAGAAAARDVGAVGALPATEPQNGLALTAVTRLRPDAVALEWRRGSAVAVAARRVGPGRVVQVGYDDSWRWRMSGVDGAPAAHRAWWSRVVAAVAYAPRVAAAIEPDGLAAGSTLDAAPVARLVATLGPSSPRPAEARPGRDTRLPHWLPFLLATLALLGEWASRRLRGQR
jgi:hypothetical protein